MTEAKRLDWFARTVAGAFLAAITASGSLWLSNRLYPLVPVAHLIGRFLVALDYAVLAVVIGLLVALIARPRSRAILLALLAVLAVLFLQDQNRWWPSFYEFSFFLLVLASMPADRERASARALALCQWMLAAVYLWSGVLKFTPSFYRSSFPWFLAPVTAHLPWLIPYLPALAIIAAAAEVLFALGLLTERFRKIALWEATSMHVLIFFFIGPFRGNWNDSAWVWSAATCAFLWILFYRAPSFSWRLAFGCAQEYGTLLVAALAVICIGILPALNLVNLWPSSLSFNVYTGNIATGQLFIDDGAVSRLPAALQPYVQEAYGGASSVDINAWSAAAFNANIVPARNIYLALLGKICSYAPADVRLVYQNKSGWGIPVTQSYYDCTGR